MPGHILDISPANPIGRDMLGLQRMAYFFGAAKPWPDVFAWGVVLLLVLVALRINLRTGAWRTMMWCSVALCVLLSLIAIYHNKYDRLLLLVILPAIAELHALCQRAVVWVLASVETFWVLSEQIFSHVLGRAEYWPVNQVVAPVLCVILLGAMARRARKSVASEAFQ